MKTTQPMTIPTMAPVLRVGELEEGELEGDEVEVEVEVEEMVPSAGMDWPGTSM